MTKRSKIITIFLFVLSGALVSLTIYLKLNFISMTFEQLLYSLLHSKGTSFNAVSGGFVFVVIGTIIWTVLLSLTFYVKKKAKHIVLLIQYKKKAKEITIFPIQRQLRLAIILLVVSLVSSMYFLNVFKYLKNQFSPSPFYEYYYVDPKNTEISFENDKHNLIYIYLEATESTIMSKENGGYLLESYIPKLEDLALNNINFSQNSQLGGAAVLNNTTWTIAGMVAQTAGITLNIPVNTTFKGDDRFLPGIQSLGDILQNNGYQNYLMMGSDSAFAGRDAYFTQHGNYKIYDYYTAIEDNIIDEDYFVWWGYEDKILFEYAKQELTKIAQRKEPFNFTLLTVDTHFQSGYLDETCEDLPFDNQYANVFYCNSNMVYEFVKWIQEQDFYKNTTIVISGDHQASQLLPIKTEDLSRTYNVFINSAVQTKYNKNREFATIDLFPTTLASIGARIDGERLGLGTNLFSGLPTLSEMYGYEYVNKEVIKQSDFYDNYFLSDHPQEEKN